MQGQQSCDVFLGIGRWGHWKVGEGPRVLQCVHATQWRLELQVSRAEAVGTDHLPDVQRIASFRWTSPVPNSYARWWERTRNSLQRIRSTWLIFLLATLLWPRTFSGRTTVQTDVEHIMENRKPYDNGQGWITTDDGVLEPTWSCCPVLPNSLADLLVISLRGLI